MTPASQQHLFPPLPLSQDKFSNASGCDDYGPIEQDIDTGAHVPRIWKERTLKVDTMLVVLENLCKAHISIMDPPCHSRWRFF